MKKLFELTGKDFLTGIAQGAHSQNSGIFSVADGIYPFPGTAVAESTTAGLLQAGPTATAFTGVTGNIVAYAKNDAAARTYVMDDDGKIYEHTSGTSASSLQTGLTNVGKGGMAIFQPTGGTKALYYWHGNTIIGQYADLDATPSFTDSWATGLQSTTIRPVHRMFDQLFYGNKDRIGKIYDVSGTATNSTNVLDFPSDFTVVDLTDDGFYLVGLITSAVTGNAGTNKVIFWDTISSSWNREWIVPDQYVTNVRQKNGVIYIWGKNKLWACTFNQPPQLVRYVKRPAQGYPCATTTYQDVLLWGDVDGNINSYGKWSTDAPNAYFKPFSTGSNASVTAVFEPSVLAGATFSILASSNDTTKVFDVGVATAATSVSAKTIYLQFKTKYIVQRIDIVFGEPLTGSDSLNLDVQTDEDTTAQDWGTYAYNASGNNRRQFKTGYVEAEQLKLILNFNGGTPRIARIEGYGEAPAFI